MLDKKLKLFLRSHYYALVPFDILKHIEHLRLREYRKSLPTSNLKAFIDHKCLFVHIPKNAGTSVSESLFDLPIDHTTIFEYNKMFDIGQFFTFAFVRNPYSRVATAFSYLKYGGTRISREDRIIADLHINRFQNLDNFVKEWITPYNVMKIVHFWPQYKFITTDSGISVDYVGRVENIKSDFTHICNKIGIQRTLSHFNKTHKRDCFYTEEAKEIVRSVYHKDFELFGYE